MMRSDSRRQEFNADNVFGDNDAINSDMIAAIEKELYDNPYESCDVISLVFLLYNNPDTALERLIVYQRVSKDIGTPNLLHAWFLYAKQTTTWKHEFVEALLLCQLNGIVRKLGLHVPSAQKHYQVDNVQAEMYINPAKKALYKLCESMNEDNLYKLKKSLLTYDIDTLEYGSCELVMLKLLSSKFITVNQYHYDRKTFAFQMELENLLRIIENLPGLKKNAQDIRLLHQLINDDAKSRTPAAASTPNVSTKEEDCVQRLPSNSNTHFYKNDFKDVFDMLGELGLEDDIKVKTLKSDTIISKNDCYGIKSDRRIGICVILNQVNFYPSKDSIENANANLLEERIGSDKDKTVIENIMNQLNFDVFSKRDLNHREIFEYLKKILENEVSVEDSVFMLCILSHGVKGHIYAADSVKVKMDDLQNFVDIDKLRNKPKLFIVQACQVDETPHMKIVADNPNNNYMLKKTNFLIYWATAPELEAYRDEDKGSFFIQILFRAIAAYVKKEHISDIFTKVTDRVTRVCENFGRPQVPIYHSTLRKKLYLYMPK